MVAWWYGGVEGARGMGVWRGLGAKGGCVRTGYEYGATWGAWVGT